MMPSFRPVDALAFNRQVCLAPMMAVTDRHFRYLCRLLTPHALLYSEMLTTGALIHGPHERLLAFTTQENPVALQLGGNCPRALATCAQMAQAAGYAEVNLNVGCPSDRVQAGGFGAAMMAQPERVTDCLTAMREAVQIPVTIKTRIGIDTTDSFKEFSYFIEKIKQSKVKTIIVHARKAWLNGLCAKQNRLLPPLRYDVVYRIAREHTDTSFIINGGISTSASVHEHLARVQGVMIGREASRNPYVFASLAREVFQHSPPLLTRQQVLQRYAAYCAQQLEVGSSARVLVRPLYGLFLSVPRARWYRQRLNELMHGKISAQWLPKLNELAVAIG